MSQVFCIAADSGLYCPVTEDVSSRLLRLPFYNDLQVHEQEKVVSCIRRFHVRRAIWDAYPFPQPEVPRSTGSQAKL